MPEPKVGFIDPAAALAALTPTPKATAKVADDLGPSPPHQLEVEPEEVPVNFVNFDAAPPSVGLGPGNPPIMNEETKSKHYTQVLDEIWPEFDDPEERTAARVRSLLEEVKEEARKLFLLAQQVWAKLPAWKVKDAERTSFDRDFNKYVKRLQAYNDELAGLGPFDPAPDEVYIGLIKRRAGAGPVPDAIMHLHFASQLGILEDHAETMSEGYVARVLDGLATVDDQIDNMKGSLDDAQAEIQEGFEEAAGEWAAGIRRGLLMIGGVLLGSVVLIGGTVAIAASAVGKARENDGKA